MKTKEQFMKITEQELSVKVVVSTTYGETFKQQIIMKNFEEKSMTDKVAEHTEKKGMLFNIRMR